MQAGEEAGAGRGQGGAGLRGRYGADGARARRTSAILRDMRLAKARKSMLPSLFVSASLIMSLALADLMPTLVSTAAPRYTPRTKLLERLVKLVGRKLVLAAREELERGLELLHLVLAELHGRLLTSHTASGLGRVRCARIHAPRTISSHASEQGTDASPEPRPVASAPTAASLHAAPVQSRASPSNALRTEFRSK